MKLAVAVESKQEKDDVGIELLPVVITNLELVKHNLNYYKIIRHI